MGIVNDNLDLFSKSIIETFNSNIFSVKQLHPSHDRFGFKHSSKYLPSCSSEQRNVYRFVTKLDPFPILLMFNLLFNANYWSSKGVCFCCYC